VIRISLAPRLDPYVRRLRDKIMNYADPRIKRPRHDLVSEKIVHPCHPSLYDNGDLTLCIVPLVTKAPILSQIFYNILI